MTTTSGVRFAPSPTGRFHIGNLRTAWVAAQFAKARRQPFIVRFEDIDTPRVRPGAQAQQLADLAALDLRPDVVQTQSEFLDRHLQLFQAGVVEGQIYPCDCSRKDVRSEIASAPHTGRAPVYSGRCRHRRNRNDEASFHSNLSLAWRFRRSDATGSQDFIVARTIGALDSRGLPDPATFVPAYHWACAIDDYDGGFELLVRATDLAVAADAQRTIQEWLGKREASVRCPALFHTSLVVKDDGTRLEKRTVGVTLSELTVSLQELTQLFQRSFDPTHFHRDIDPGSMAGEDRELLTLTQLGLSVSSRLTP